MKRVFGAMLFFALAAATLALPASAQVAQPAAEDPALEARVMRISDELRCLVCQNQTIADSHASLAVDLRNQIRDMLQQGKSEAQIRTYMVERYGDFVLYRPPLKHTTWLLWFGPALLIAIGSILLWVVLRRRAHDQDIPLTDAQRREAHVLLQDEGGTP